MNYAGTFHATFPSEGPDTHSHAYTHVDSSQTHAPADAIIVPDAQLLFHADYARSGTDLILSRDHHEYVVHDYFTGGKRAPLASPDGAHLTADIVKALVGEVDVSQAGTAPAASQVIGHVTKLQGSATVIRNGVSVILNMGDNVEKGDVVESGANSTVGITFIDGTVFGLSSNARMVLNEMVYDPNGSSNSSLLSLVAGTITFVAGETAKHGDMKIDTPVATMGIRGTAVLVEIDFSVPGQGGQPNASFQVLVEPDGTTGSYILFDKNTLQPIAIVNQAGQQININNGIINITTNPLSPDLQKLITDVFQQKFTDNTNTKSTAPSTDSIIPTSNPLVIKIGENVITTQTVNVQSGSTQAPPTLQNGSTFHVSGPPIIHIANLLGVETSSFLASGEQAGLTGSPLPDGAVGIVSFNDINVGDRPSVTPAFDSFTYKNAHGQDVTGGLSALQLADIAATEVNLTIVPGGNNTNVGSAFFIYGVADQAFDFLAAGEQLTLTYLITVNENYAPDPTAKITVPITITIIGTNDAPVITTSAHPIAFTPSGTKTVGGDLLTKNATSGTLAFTDVDLTDTHKVATKLTSAVMSNGGTVPPLPESVFEAALSAAIGVDSTGTGAGTINWQLAPLPVYLSDFIPPHQTLTLTYTITVTDSQGAISTQTVTVTITGNDNPAVVWIHTTTDGHDNLWTTANNWETGTVPTSADDVIIITDQLHPKTPAYPVTIDGKTTAAANSVTMNDFVSLPPELDVLKGGSLAIVDALSMSADSVLNNAGTITVGGKLELLDSFDANNKFTGLNTSVIINSGTLSIALGGDIMGAATGKDANGNAIPRVTNSGLIDLTGGTLNVAVNIANSGTDANGKPVGGEIKVEHDAKLALSHDSNGSATVNGSITGGTVTISGELDLQGSNFVDGGTLSNSGNVFVAGLGNSFDAETIANTGTIELKSGAALAIDQGSSVSGSGTIMIDGTATLTLDDATISGNTINDYDTSGNGTIAVTGDCTINGGAKLNKGTVNVDAKLTLDTMTVSGATINDKSDGSIEIDHTVQLAGGAMIQGSSNTLGAITNLGKLEISGAAELLDIALNNGAGTLQIDDTDTLTLSGTTITGGIVNDYSSIAGGTIDVAADSAIDGSATLNKGTVNVDAKLTLDTMTVSGTTINDKSDGSIEIDHTVQLTGGATIKGSSNAPGTVTNLGKLEISGTGMLLDIALNNGAGTVQLDDTDTLTLNGTTIAGGAINDYSSTVGGTIDVAGDSAIDGSATLIKGTVNVDAKLTLDTMTVSGATINDKSDGSIELDHTVQLTGGATIQGTSTHLGTITNLGELEISGAATLADIALNNAEGAVQVDGPDTLTLDGTTITGGSISDSGTVEVKGSSKIQGATALGVVTAATLSNGGVTVDANQTLTLDNVSVTGTTFTDTATGATLALDGGTQLTLSGVTIHGGTINDGTSSAAATIDVTGNSTIDSGATLNNGAVDIAQGFGLTLDDVTVNGTSFVVDGSTPATPGELILQGSTSLTGSQITIDSNDKLVLDQATITGGSISNGDVIEVRGSSKIQGTTTLGVVTAATLSNGGVTVDANQTLTLDNVTVTGTTFTDTATGATLALDSGTQLTLDGVTIHGGTVNDGTSSSGATIDVTGNSTIDSGATLNNGAVDIAQGFGLTLDDVTVNGTSFVVDGSTPATPGELILQDSTSLTGSQITIDGNDKLVLDQATITGGSISNGDVIEVRGSSKIQGTTTLGVVTAATLSNGGVTVDANQTLTLDNVSVTGTTFTDTATGATLALDGGTQLTLDGVTIHGGTINDGTSSAGATIDVTGNSTIDSGATLNSGNVDIAEGFGLTLDNVTVNGTSFVVDGAAAPGELTLQDGTSLTGSQITIDSNDKLILDQATISGGSITNGDAIEVKGSSKIQGTTTLGVMTAATLSNGGVTVDANQILSLDNVSVTGTTFTDTASAATLALDGGTQLTLSGATIHGGTINDGTSSSGAAIDVTGASRIDSNARLNNGGVTIAQGAILTLDDVTVNGTSFVVNGASPATPGELILQDGTSLTGSQITVDGNDQLIINQATITGGSITNSGTIYNQAGSDVIAAAVSNTGTIEVQSGTLNLADGVTGGGQLVVDAGATLELAGADKETVTLEGGADVTTTLQLDSTAILFNGTITVNATGGGTFDVNGQSSITTSSGDGLDVNASGTSGAPANVTVNLGGAIKGAANGIVVTQNGYGSLTVDITGAVTGNGAGDVGLLVQNLDALNSANINVTATGGASGDVYGINVVNDGNGNISLEAGGAITTGNNTDSKYGIRVVSQGTGSETVKTDADSSISSAGTGINVINIDGIVGSGAQSSITVTTYGTIHSHSAANNDGSVAAGIYAGYRGVGSSSPAVPDLSVNGSVTVNNNDTLITADTGYGINAYNWGQGSITVNDGTDPTVGATKITAGQTGIGAYANSGGAGDITINVGEHATISGGTTDGIQAFSVGTGKISVTTSATDSITGGTSGIAATNADTALDGSLGSTIKVTAYGTINSGASPNGVQTAAGILAGYSGNGANGPAPSPNDNVHGDVTVDTYASITTQTGYGIDAFNWGTGDVTVIAEASSSINAADIGIGAFANDGGDVSVTLHKDAVDTGSIGLSVHATGAGTVSITNDGEITGRTDDGILVNQAGGTGSTTITNSGTVAGVTSASTAVVVVHENTTGHATIDNSGTIGAALVAGTAEVAIYEDGGNVSIDNSGTINGAFNVANGSFTNETDGVWNAAGTSSFGTATGTAFTIGNAGIINLSGATLSAAHGLTITDSGTVDAVSGTDAIHGASITVTAKGILESTGGTLTLDAQSPITNDAGGTIEASGGGTLNINGTLDNAGTITASGGILNIGGAVSDTGSATIANNGILHFSSDVAATQTITFQDGTGTLAVSDITDFHAAIAGFGAGDKIDLTGIALTAGEYDVWANGTLSIYSGTTLEAQLKLSGTHTQGDFALASDGHGGTEVVWSTEQASPVSGLDNVGNPVEGYSVTANLSDPTSSPAVTYTWLENGTIVGSGATFTPTAPSELNKALDVVIGFTDNGVTEQITEPAGTVTAAPAVTFGTTSPVTTVAGTALQLGGLQATFADAGSDTITATLAVVDGTLAIGNEQSIGSANNAGSITLTGTLAQINAALASGVTYTPTAGFGGNDMLAFSISDTTTGHTFTGNGSLTIAVDKLTANNDAIANATPPSAAGWVLDTADGHYYRYVSASGDYAAAQAGAANDKVYLATITSAAENSFVAGLLPNGATAWTAGETQNANPSGSDPQGTGNSPDTTAIWSWNAGPESGNLFTYTHWNQGEPNGGFGATDAALQVGSNGGWNDVPTPAIGVGYAGYVEEWGGLSGEIAFNENNGGTIADPVLLANDTDSLGRTFTITSVSGKSAHGGTVVLDGNSIDYTPASNYAGADSFTYTISDGLTTSTATVSFTVQGTQNHWNGGTGDWANAADWSFETPPVAGIDAIFDASGAYVVTITAAEVAKTLTITSAGAGADIQDKTGGSLTLGGALTIDAGSFSLIGGSLSATSIDVESAGHFIAQGSVSAPITNNGGIVQAVNTLTLSGLLTNSGTVEIDGTLQLTGGAKIQGPSNTQLGAITNLGLLEILGAATLLDVAVANTGHNIKVDSGQTLDFDNSTINSGTLTVNGELDSTGTSAINNATIVNQNNIHVISGTLTIDPTKVTNTGTILVDSGTALDLQSSEIDGGKVTISGELDSSGNSLISGATIVNDGLIDIKGGTLTIDATSVLSGTGGFKLDGGLLALKGALAGNIDIGGAATVELESSSSTAYTNATVIFDQGSTGTLKLDFAEDFGGKVSGFATKQTLDLADVAYSSKPIVVYTGDASGGVLAVYVNGHDVANIDLTGDYRGVQWVLSSDGHGGTDIKESTEGPLVATFDHTVAQQGVTMHVTGVKDGLTSISVNGSSLSYAWQVSTDGQFWTTVGSGSSFTPGEAQEGHLMQLVVTYTDTTGTQDVVYQLGMPNDLSITVDQTTAQQGLPIHVTSVSDGGTIETRGVSYLWETSTDGHTWTQVGHSSSYTPSYTSDGGKLLQVVVSYSDPGENESVTQTFGTVALAKEWTGGSQSWETDAAWSPAGAPTSSDNAVVDTNGHVTVDQSSAAAHSLVENASLATVEIVSGGMLTLGGNLLIEQGHFQVDAGGTLKDISDSATLSGSFTNNGTVEAGGGKLEITDTVSGSGSFKIDSGATLQLDHASSANVTFSGQGTLALEDPTHFTGIISDSTGSLTDKDVLDLAGFDSNATVSYSGTTSGGSVKVSENGKIATIKVGENTTHWTKPVSDGHGGILIEDPVVNDATPPSTANHPWSTAGADGFVFKTNPGANAGSDADHGPVWLELGNPDSTAKVAQFVQNHEAAELPNLQALQDGLTPDSLKTQLLSHHNEFHFV